MIDVIEIKKIIEKFKDIKDNYYDIFINYYNSIDEIKNCWRTSKGVVYYSIICDEKKVISEFIYNLDDFLETFLYLIEEYSKIGDRINYDLLLEDGYINLKNDLANYMNNIINIYNNLNLVGSDAKIISLVENEKTKLVKFNDNLGSLCEKNRKVLRKIESIEKNIKRKISKIEVVIIGITDIKDYDLKKDISLDVSITDSQKMESIYNKVQMYIDEENALVEDINNLFVDLSNYYKTDNLNAIEKLESEIIINMNNILSIHNLNLDVLGKEIVSVEELERATSNNFKNIIN